MGLIMGFDRAKPESAIYDPQSEGQFEVFMDTFKGVKIVSMDPVVVEWYSDSFSMDAELTAAWYSFWVNYSYGQGSWPMIAMMNKAEAEGLLAYTDRKPKRSRSSRPPTSAAPAWKSWLKTG